MKPREDPDGFAQEVEFALHRDIVGAWFPRCIDPSGGYHQTFARDWSPIPDGEKFLVFQSRMIWVSSKLAGALPERRDEFDGYALHGVRFLRERFFDSENGGYRWIVPDDAQRMTYGLAFALYGLSAAAAASGSDEVLGQAKDLFGWIEEHLHDAEHGGWFEVADPTGRALLEPEPNPRSPHFGGIGSRYGLKIQNTHLHLLEALTELYGVWPNALVRERLEEAVDILSRRMYAWPGALHVTLTRDWKPLPRACSFGHDVEAAYLLIEAAAALGRPEDETTWTVARALVKHALTFGFDHERGGFYEQGEAAGRPWDKTRGWWTQVEGLNALAALVCLGGDDHLRPALAKQWHWVRTRQIDGEHPGLFARTDEEGRLLGSDLKGHMWKAAYHDGRALMNLSKWLRVNDATKDR